jgi:hypothetical protein
MPPHNQPDIPELDPSEIFLGGNLFELGEGLPFFSHRAIKEFYCPDKLFNQLPQRLDRVYPVLTSDRVLFALAEPVAGVVGPVPL